MNAHVADWIEKVLREREEMLPRIAPIEVKLNPQQARDAIMRAAAALLEWEHATGNIIKGRGGK